MMKRPTKAIIAAAGFGTRFLPQTKAMPKEMMPLIDKPIIQYVVEELVDAGIKDIIIVGSASKRAIEDHFDLPNEDLLANLRAGGDKKKPLLDQVEAIANLANFVYLRQKGAYGNATPIQCAAHLMEKDDEYDKYGFVSGAAEQTGEVKVDRIIEKPGKANAPSELGSVSEFLFTPEIFDYLEKAHTSFDGHGEFMIQPVVQAMINDGWGVYAREIIDGRFYDTGDKLEYLKTMIDFGLDHPKLGSALREHLLQRVAELSEISE